MLIRLDESYKVADGPVRLSVRIGNGQPGYLRVRVDGTLVADGNDHLEGVELGEGSELKGSEVSVLAIVTDTNPNHNRTNVQFQFAGGVKDENFSAAYEFDRPNQTARYAARFELL